VTIEESDTCSSKPRLSNRLLFRHKIYSSGTRTQSSDSNEYTE